MKKPTICLHVGLSKTGTTSLQSFLFRNHAALKDYGINYPVAAVTSWGANGNFFMRGHTRSYSPEKEEAIARQLSDDKINVISSESMDEMFYWTTPEVWYGGELVNCFDQFERTLHEYKEKYKKYQFQIVIYLRRQDSYLNSLVGQVLKLARPMPLHLQPYIDAGALSYLERLNVYARVFGKENVIVRVYERDQLVNQDIISDFLDIFDCKFDAKPSVKVPKENLSLCRKSLLIANELSKINDTPDLFGDCFRPALANYSKVSNCGERNIFSVKELHEVVVRYQGENSSIAENYLGRSSGEPLFSESRPDPESISEELSLETVIQFFGRLSIDQYKEIERLKQQVRLKSIIGRAVRRCFRLGEA
ncbi:hypothetical protein N8491_03210 [Akkermansiaceae bacterium]|nr:hypothetical protein [Akkermansiaceae bacterium]MDB4695342.1 hypothetical protein [Akkermansiaceae bacterium]